MSSKPPVMERSRSQLAGAYAPHRPFIFEGGEGACMTIPSDGNQQAGLKQVTKGIITEQISEYFEAWAQRATRGDGLRHEVSPTLAVDRSALSGGGVRIRMGDLVFQTPSCVGYVPFPLSFSCKRCGLHRECRSLQNAATEMAAFQAACPNRDEGCADDWQQIDVVMTHWSGSVEGVTPTRRVWPRVGTEIQEIKTCESCRGDRFYLRRPPGPLAAWHFECVSCHSIRAILLRDRDTLKELGPMLQTGQALPAEMNMEPISIRASALHYTHGDRLLVFDEDRWLSLLNDTRTGDLTGFLAARYGYPSAVLPDPERRAILVAAGREAEWTGYVASRDGLAMLEAMPAAPQDMLDGMRLQLAAIEAGWNASVFAGFQQAAPGIVAAAHSRADWIRRYDPVRMVVEHATLEAERMHGGRLPDGKQPYVDVRHPDPFLTPDNLSVADKAAMLAQVSSRLEMLGVREMRLIRDVRVCEYTFGYSRTESLPIVKRETKLQGGVMPVRLRLHGRVRVGDGAAHPVLCIEQSNEGFYVRLDEQTVLGWLEENAVRVPPAGPGVHLGGRLIEDYAEMQNDDDLRFTRFLDEYRRERAMPRRAYPYVFTLLHTAAHHLITVASAMSGLDLGSFGEHLFVPDLAFMIYRRGTTMDLGNLSSMWRERGDPAYGNEVLERMVSSASLRCGSETVCNQRGGACPDCILIPENACLTRNELLSRSVLVGRGTPRWDADSTVLTGYYDYAAARAAAAQHAP